MAVLGRGTVISAKGIWSKVTERGKATALWLDVMFPSGMCVCGGRGKGLSQKIIGPNMVLKESEKIRKMEKKQKNNKTATASKSK